MYELLACFLLFFSIPYFRNSVSICIWYLNYRVLRTSHTVHLSITVFSPLPLSLPYFLCYLFPFHNTPLLKYGTEINNDKENKTMLEAMEERSN